VTVAITANGRLTITMARRARLLLLVGVGILALASAVISWRLRSSNQFQSQPVQTASNDPETIPLKVEGGTLLVPVLINDRITLDFTVDSGAADVSIPADVVSTLNRTSKKRFYRPRELRLGRWINLAISDFF